MTLTWVNSGRNSNGYSGGFGGSGGGGGYGSFGGGGGGDRMSNLGAGLQEQTWGMILGSIGTRAVLTVFSQI
jgi:hypothetical protein